MALFKRVAKQKLRKSAKAGYFERDHPRKRSTIIDTKWARPAKKAKRKK